MWQSTHPTMQNCAFKSALMSLRLGYLNHQISVWWKKVDIEFAVHNLNARVIQYCAFMNPLFLFSLLLVCKKVLQEILIYHCCFLPHRQPYRPGHWAKNNPAECSCRSNILGEVWGGGPCERSDAPIMRFKISRPNRQQSALYTVK